MPQSDVQAVLDRIRPGLVYTESEASFQDSRRRTDLIFEYNHTPPGEADRRRSLLVAILGSPCRVLRPVTDDDLTTRAATAG